MVVMYGGCVRKVLTTEISQQKAANEFGWSSLRNVSNASTITLSTIVIEKCMHEYGTRNIDLEGNVIVHSKPRWYSKSLQLHKCQM